MQFKEIYYPKVVESVCAFPLSPCSAMWKVCLETTVVGPNKKLNNLGNRNWFFSVKGTKAGESLLKQISWIVAAELERLGLPNDSLQVLAE